MWRQHKFALQRASLGVWYLGYMPYCLLLLNFQTASLYMQTLNVEAHLFDCLKRNNVTVRSRPLILFFVNIRFPILFGFLKYANL